VIEMPKNTTLNIRVDSAIKDQAGEILSSLGLTLSEAFNLMLHQVRIVRGLPFEVKQRLPIELNDGHGSYICAFGHVHDYSKTDLGAITRESELAGPFKTFEAFKASLEGDNDDEV
jgi:addiction module RelB/DinJ family antitoxin